MCVFEKYKMCVYLQRLTAQKPRILPLLCCLCSRMPLYCLCLVCLQNVNVCLQKIKCVKCKKNKYVFTLNAWRFRRRGISRTTNHTGTLQETTCYSRISSHPTAACVLCVLQKQMCVMKSKCVFYKRQCSLP